MPQECSPWCLRWPKNVVAKGHPDDNGDTCFSSWKVQIPRTAFGSATTSLSCTRCMWLEKQLLLCVAFQFPSLNVSILNGSMDVKARKRWHLNKIPECGIQHLSRPSQARLGEPEQVSEAPEVVPSATCPGASREASLLSSSGKRVSQKLSSWRRPRGSGQEEHCQMIRIYTSLLRQFAFPSFFFF